MKESVTKFDLEAAFKALDEIDVPVSKKGIKANKPALTEIFSRKSKFDALFEEYYDVGSTEELGEAKEEREAEIAKAKLARIEKIVDLDADSPEDLLTSYVGKYIIQCPQCMTLFYKDKEDVVESEEDPTNVNVGEQCQHCGNESGYTLIGKVGEAEPEEAAELAGEVPTEETASEETSEEANEVTPEETSEEAANEADDLDINLDDLNLEEPAEEEKKEESFIAHTGETLVEEVIDDKELDAKLEAHSEYIEYLRNTIAEEEIALEKTDNEQVKAAIQRRIDAFKADLEAALPEEVKNDIQVESTEEPIEEVAEEQTAEEQTAEEQTAEEPVEEPVEESLTSEGTTLTEGLKEDADLDVSADEFEELINSLEFTKPISDVAVRSMLNSEKEETEEKVAESISLEEGIFDKLKLLTRAGKAEWILANALKDYTKAVINSEGSAETAANNRKFKTFTVAYFKNNFNGKDTEIETAPKISEIPNLVKGQNSEDKTSYTDAENIAKGWSKIPDNGPAIIFMSNGVSDTEAEFLCMYFNGGLVKESDQLAKQFEKVKNGLAGGKSMAKGKAGQADTKQIKAKELKNGMQINTKNKGTAEITEVIEGDVSDLKITYKLQDGSTVSQEVAADQAFNVLALPNTTESLNTVMNNIEELNESTLEKLISDSLVEAYGNVAGYRLTNCEYLNEKFNINGTIYFTSGKTRNTTYNFSEAFIAEEKVSLIGLNEKLGVEKQFVLTGNIKDKTLITESFKCNKK